MKCLKELERKNGRLKRLVADQALDIQILKEVAKVEFYAQSYDVGSLNTSEFSSLSRNDEHVAWLGNIEVCNEAKLLRTHIECALQRVCAHSHAGIRDMVGDTCKTCWVVKIGA